MFNCQNNEPKCCVILASHIPSDDKLWIGKDILDKIKKYLPSSTKIFVGINPSQCQEEWINIIKEYTPYYDVTPPHLVIKSDASAYQTALRLYKKHINQYDLVWFLHTKGTKSEADNVREDHLTSLLVEINTVLQVFKNMDCGAYGRTLSPLPNCWSDCDFDLYLERFGIPFKHRPIRCLFTCTMWVMRGDILNYFILQCNDSFFNDLLVNPHTNGEGDMYFFERDFIHIVDAYHNYILYGKHIIHNSYPGIFTENTIGMSERDIYNKLLYIWRNKNVYKYMFDWQYYLNVYPDLRENGVHTEEQAITHWNTHGKIECRRINFNMFDWQYYLDTYPDLRQNGVHTSEQALQHWHNNGKFEGRNSNNKFTYLLDEKQHIFNIKHKAENTDFYYTHFVFKNIKITRHAISIIMTASNRSKQTYFTLKSIAHSVIKDIQVIIVDDSDIDPINNEQLNTYPFHIDLIKINKSTKEWHNPLVNYNIGFKFIKGNFIIIQNAEVCHIGDVCNYIKSNAIDNNYYIFDVNASLDFDTNEVIYNYDITNTSIYNNNNLFSQWYQSEDVNRKYHFLSGMTKQTFKKINGFSYDCTVGICYDDDDFLLKIISKNINTVNVFHTIHNVGGIHQFHTISSEAWDNNKPTNELLLNLKKNVYAHTGEYIDFTNSSLEFDINYDTYLR